MMDVVCGRRGLLSGLGLMGAVALIPNAALAALPERRLAFRNVHTNERFDACYFRNGTFDPKGMAEIREGLRDWRTNEIHQMDIGLIQLLSDLRDRLGVSPRQKFDLISGYRSPNTNNALRERGGEHTGVATKSQHMLGRATDIALPGVPLDRLRSAALTMQRGGVGFYPRDGFVHVDTGRVRSW